MNTKVLKIAFILSLFGMTFNSCQDEDIESANAPKSRSIPDGMQCLMIPDTTTSTHSLSKKAIGKKFSEVYFQTFDDSIPDKYKTIKIRDVKGNICQEWFYENLHSKLINDYSHQPNDPDGTKHGYFYMWEGYLDNIELSEWNELVLNAKGEYETGFHIPDEKDMRNLKSIVGNTPQIRTLLNLEYGNAYYDAELTPNKYSNNSAGFWIIPQDYEMWNNHPNCIDPNKVEGCGVPVLWHRNDTTYKDGMWITFTNIKDLRCSVRLMRTINKNQW